MPRKDQASLDKGKIDVVNEIHKSARKNFARRHVIQRGIHDCLQIDLVEMLPYARFNQGQKYLLTCIDIFSKMAYARPMKNKTSKETSMAMESILREIGNIPKNIQSDQGKEFFGKDFKQLMNKYGINHYCTYSHLKASIVERFNRTLKTWMWKLFSLNGNYKWTPLLSDLLSKYNKHYHRTIKMSPCQVNKRNERLLLHTVYNYPNEDFPAHKFEVDDKVRISKYKGVFYKGYQPNWSTEIFTIVKVQPTLPVTYILKDHEDSIISGAFYEQELQTVRNNDIYLVEKILKERNGKLFIKWLGFSDRFNSWINKEDLQ